MLRRIVRVLIIVVQPLDPVSRVGAWIQVLVTLAGTGALAFVPFLAADWTWQKAGTVVLAAFAVLSLRAAYRLQADRDAALTGTLLQDLIVQRLRMGEELQRRIKRRKGDELPRNLANELADWGGATVVQIHEAAADVGGDLYDSIGFTPQSLSRKEARGYMRRSLAILRRLARELRA